MAACTNACICAVFHCVDICMCSLYSIYARVPLYSTKGIDDAALNKKKFVACLDRACRILALPNPFFLEINYMFKPNKVCCLFDQQNQQS